MTYTVASVLGVGVALIVDLGIARTRLVSRRVFWATYPIVLTFQLIFNGILTGLGVVRYQPTAIIGVRLFHAPIEDLAFGFALVLLTLSLWVRAERRASRAHGGATASRPSQPPR